MMIYRVQEIYPLGGTYYEKFFLDEKQAFQHLEKRLQYHRDHDLAEEEDCVYLDEPIMEIENEHNDLTLKSYALEIWVKGEGMDPEDDLLIIHLELEKIYVQE